MLSKDVLASMGPPPASLAGVSEQLDDLGAGRLALMDAAGIDVQVLSAVSWGVQALEPVRSLELSRQLNQRMADTVVAHPGRFAAFAALPMSDPSAAAVELHRCVEELGFVGAMIHGQTNGVFLDDPVNEPILAATEALEVPLYLHPAPPPPAVAAAYFSGLEPAVAGALSTAAWGWHAECGLHVLRMVANGVFERFAGLQLLVGHMGEMLPFSLARADERLSPLLPRTRTVADTLHAHLLVTTSGYTTTAPLQCALAVIGADRILFSVDHPFADSAAATAWLTSAPLSPGDREKIAHGNAERLLRL